MKARTLLVLGTALGFAACGGNPFGSGDDDDTPLQTGGSSSDAGKSGKAEAGEGVGAGTTGGVENGSAGDRDGGATPPGAGGAPPSAGGSDDGAAGEPPVVVEPVFTTSKLIDDMEDGDATLKDTNGDWFVFNDKTAGTSTPTKGAAFTMTTLTPARGASMKAAVVTVSGFTDWGAAFGFDFRYVGSARQPFDLGPALAMRFWAKASKAVSVRLQMPNADTDEAAGKCTTGENACGAHWTKAFKVGTEWKQTTIQLSELKQDLPGRHVPTFDKQQVYSTFFVIGANESVTVWVDDLALVH